ncbi:hypothetical protein GQF42_00395 [Streptomyces broussonetiae]|uniref:Uncharacterized protein n=1 Tax=Streptomyces broussonetiae TaxID=2686304 RepID=A0A6I6MSS3_9ACTN|nr:hypothetical protein [Streptomyces broussonetiae]QHA02034.1 hypothetical protein GQF42_00395 [Streptomyces broussonetiae]
MTSAQDIAERVAALLGWAGHVRILPGGDGTDGTEPRIVHDAEAWWLAISVDMASGAALARAGDIDLGGTHLAPYTTSMPAPAEDTGAVVLALTAAREDLDGMGRYGRQGLSFAGTVWLVFDGGLTRISLECRRCRARTGHYLSTDLDVGLATLRCAGGHLTRDHRVSVDGVVEAIARHESRVPGDLDMVGFSTR